MLVSCIVPSLLLLPPTSSFWTMPLISPSNVNKHTANRLGDVGVTLITTSGNRVTGFSPLFSVGKIPRSSKCCACQRHSPGFSARLHYQFYGIRKFAQVGFSDKEQRTFRFQTSVAMSYRFVLRIINCDDHYFQPSYI